MGWLPLSCEGQSMRPSDSAGRVEAGWQEVQDDGRIQPEVLEAAYSDPLLRVLFPWTGMGEFHFSHCAEKRWTWDIPYIGPAEDGGYWVLGPVAYRIGRKSGPRPRWLSRWSFSGFHPGATQPLSALPRN